ncbi:MAG TPA: metalloregulator ArsR/SmtB family transcription factor [Pedomonas sp.]|uniref:ArsR/SmtB family transcription factor n=1 Tax=Pedomonas sp. TaxID=2976421 RepID=UPI002F4059C8
MPKAPMDLPAFAAKASEVADILSLLANQRRLMVLCRLTEREEMTVSELAEAVGLSQSALSQHLAKMREQNLVTYRRESQTLWYRLADPRIEALLSALYDTFCAPPPEPATGATGKN